MSQFLNIPGLLCCNCQESKQFLVNCVHFFPLLNRSDNKMVVSAVCHDCWKEWQEKEEEDLKSLEQAEKERQEYERSLPDEKKCDDCGCYLWKVGGYDPDKDCICHIPF